MHCWLIHQGENLPVDGKIRLMRYGLLAEALSDRGHSVTYWAPTFNHFKKEHRFFQDTDINLRANYRLKLLHVSGYSKNISVQRILFHRNMACAFLRSSQLEERPDVVICSLPTPEMCISAINYGSEQNIPVIIDVRDLWPDIYLTVIPRPLRVLGRLLFEPQFRKNREIFSGATAIIAVSNSYLDWAMQFADRPRSRADRVFPLVYPEAGINEEEVNASRKMLLSTGVQPEKTICCFFGQFEASYDLDTVLKAARILLDSGENEVQFVLCGSGNKSARLKTLASDLSNVIMPGWVSFPTLHALLGMSQIGLATYAEAAQQSLPNKPIEYLAGALPVVSSLRGELHELLETHNCGLYYKAGDANQLAEAIAYLRNNKTIMQEMSRNARLLYESRFSEQVVLPNMVDHIEAIVRGIVDVRRSR